MPVKSKTDTTNSTSSIAAEVRGATSRVFQRTCAGAASPLGITLKSGESVQGALVDSTDSQLSIKQSKIGRDIAKADIALVDYIRIKPIPENRNIEFPTEILDPRIWPFIFKIGVLMRVPLFNVALPEDDEFFQCVFHH
jgi:hypothetical protein